MSIFKRTQRKYVKKAYRVRNWREYEAGLRNRGSLTVWVSLTAGKLVNWDAPRPRTPPTSVGEPLLAAALHSLFVREELRISKEHLAPHRADALDEDEFVSVHAASGSGFKPGGCLGAQLR